VPRRQNDELTERLTLAAYSSRLADYPADVVREALLGHVWRFWPSWYELHKFCEGLTAPRRQMLASLRKRIVSSTTEDAPGPRISPEEARRILQEHGFTPKRFAAVQTHRMAQTETELLAREAEAPLTRWTGTADPEGPEMAASHTARSNDHQMQPHPGASSRNQAAGSAPEGDANLQAGRSTALPRAC